MDDEKYYLNNKLYNITYSRKLYESINMELSGMIFMGKYETREEVKTRVYESSKGNLFKTIARRGRIAIVDIDNDDFEEMLLINNELELLRELYPLRYQQLEEY